MEVGDYVKTKYGISKIEEDRRIKYGFIHPIVDILKKEVIIKSSPNIIDLIEVGDYVNGERVINIMKKHEYLEVSDEEITIDKDDIKSIVTKEQFKDMEYEVE